VSGALLAAAGLAIAIALPLTGPVLVPALAVIGLGLGIFTPANNAMIMAGIPATAVGIGGGLVNLGRGLGTALGVALTTLALQRAGADGPRLALGLMLAAAVLAAALSAQPARR